MPNQHNFPSKRSIIAKSVLMAMGISLSNVSAQGIDYGSFEELFEESVTTSATGKPQRASDTPVPMTIVTADDIRRIGATNIPDAIRNVVGVDVIRTGKEAADVGVRGFNSPYNPRLLVLVNGRQVYSDHFGMTFWNSIPVQMSEIRQIEVVRGPNTALFGFNAATGAINIVTYNPLYDDVSKVELIVGTENSREISFTKTHRWDKGGILISASHLEADAFDVDGPRVIPETDPETSMLRFQGEFRLDEKSELSAEFTYSTTERSGFTPVFTGSSPEVDTSSFMFSYVRDSSFGLIKAQIYRNDLEHDTTVIGFGDLLYDNDLTVFQIEDLFSVGTDHNFRLFTELRDNNFEGNFDVTFPDGVTVRNPLGDSTESSINSLAFSGMWDWAINSKFNLNVSGRYDKVFVERDGFTIPGSGITNEQFDAIDIEQFTYNAGLIWNVTDTDRLTFSIARGAKLPSLIDFSAAAIGPAPLPFQPPGQAPRSTFTVFGNPDLDAAEIDSVNLSYIKKLENINGQLEINLFHAEIDSIASLASFIPEFPPFPPPGSPPPPGPVDALSKIQDVGSSEEDGIEIELSGKNGDTHWGFNYAYTDVDDDINNVRNPFGGSGFLDAADFELGTPEQVINLNIGTTFNSRWDADVYVQWRDSRELFRAQLSPQGGQFNLVAVDDLLTVSGQVTYHINNNWNLRFSAVGLGEDDYLESAADEISSQLYLTISGSF